MEEEGVLGGVMEFFVSTRYYGFDIGPFFPFSFLFLSFFFFFSCYSSLLVYYCVCFLSAYVSTWGSGAGFGGSLVTVDINSHSGLVELENRNIN